MANLKEILEWLDENAWEYVKTENAGIQKVYKGYDSESLIADMALIFREDEQAGSHPVNQWHKVEDELPPVDKYRGLGNFSIETLFTDGKYMFVGVYSFKSKMWIDRDYCFPTGRITHWMELPELPKDKI